MAKKNIKKQSSKKNSAFLWIIGSVVLIAGAFGAITLLGGDEATTITRITPARYADETSLLTHTLVDVRTPEEYAEGHIQGAVNIPLDDLPVRMTELGKDETIVLYCRSGNRSDQAARLLLAEGYQSIYDLGGLIDWTAAGYPIVTE